LHFACDFETGYACHFNSSVVLYLTTYLSHVPQRVDGVEVGGADGVNHAAEQAVDAFHFTPPKDVPVVDALLPV
jgi:hypothetical protein